VLRRGTITARYDPAKKTADDIVIDGWTFSTAFQRAGVTTGDALAEWVCDRYPAQVTFPDGRVETRYIRLGHGGRLL
jgi:hypothetical protein